MVVKILSEWKMTKAPRDATYGALVKVLRNLKNNATADRVEELERKFRTSEGDIVSLPTPHVQVNPGSDIKHYITIIYCSAYNRFLNSLSLQPCSCKKLLCREEMGMGGAALVLLHYQYGIGCPATAIRKAPLPFH